MKAKEFIANYCKANNLILVGYIGYLDDCCCNIDFEEEMFIVKSCKKHIYFRRKNSNMNYKSIIKDGYLILL